MVIKWVQSVEWHKLPVVELKIVIVKDTLDLPTSLEKFESPDRQVIYTKNADVIVIPYLEVFTVYHVCFSALSWKGSSNDSRLCAEKDRFTTAEGGKALFPSSSTVLSFNMRSTLNGGKFAQRNFCEDS